MSGETYAIGAYSKFWVLTGTTDKADTYTHGASSVPMEFLTEDVKRTRRSIGGTEIRGTRVSHIARTRLAHYEYGGSVVKYISPLEMNTFLPMFQGAEAATDFFDPDDEIPYCSLLFQRDSGVFATAATSIFEYDNMKLDKFILRGRATQQGEDSEPQLVTCATEWVGCDQDEVALPGSLPAIDVTAQNAPYIFADCDGEVKLVGGTARPIEEFIIMWDNQVKPKYVNSLNPYALRSHDRYVRVRLKCPWNDVNDDLYDQAIAGAAATIKLSTTAAAYSTEFAFTNLQIISEETPTTQRGKNQISLYLDLIGRDSAATGYECRVTNDITA